MKILKGISFGIITLLFMLIARDISLLSHEWTHSTIAWLFNLKDNPMHIHYGGWMFTNIYAVDTGNFYANLFATGKGHIASFIAIGGPGMNLFLTIVGFLMLSILRRNKAPLTSYFFFWFTLFNLSQIYSYIPTRAFSHSGDIGFFLKGFGLSPWLLFIPVTIAVYWAFIFLLKNLLPEILDNLNVIQLWAKRLLLFLAVALMFFWFGIAALYYYGIHDIMSISYPISIIMGIIVFTILLRTKNYK